VWRRAPTGRTRGLRARLATVALGVLALPAPAVAHARLVRSSPADGASLSAAPGELTLCFNELLERQFHAIELDADPDAKSPTSRRAVSLTPSVDPREGTCLLATLPAVAPGPYVVRWRVVSRDGHTTRGMIRFRVG
jgi:methionine-rich copper-binding protein CopC